jgi:hypothetical protein
VIVAVSVFVTVLVCPADAVSVFVRVDVIVLAGPAAVKVLTTVEILTCPEAVTVTVTGAWVETEVTVTVLTPGHCVPPVGLAVALVSVPVPVPPVGLAVALVDKVEYLGLYPYAAKAPGIRRAKVKREDRPMMEGKKVCER